MTFDRDTVLKGVNATVDLIQNFIPLIPVAGPAAPLINKVIDTLQDLEPMILDQVDVTYEAVKNIITALSNNPGTPEEQLAALRAIDKRVDDAWDAIESQLDPDAPSAA